MVVAAPVSYPDDELTVFSTISSREIVDIIDSKYRITEEESEFQYDNTYVKEYIDTML